MFILKTFFVMKSVILTLATIVASALGATTKDGYELSSVGSFSLHLGENQQDARESRDVLEQEELPENIRLQFSAFETEYNFEKLDLVKDIFGAGSTVSIKAGDRLVKTFKPSSRTYRSQTENGFVSATVHQDGLITAHVFDGQSVLSVEPMWLHEEDLNENAKRDLSGSGLVAYRDDQIEGTSQQFCGAIDFKSERSEGTKSKVELSEQSSSRDLLAVQKWTNCFPNDSVARRFKVGMAADLGYYKKFGSKTDAVLNSFQSLISLSNRIYLDQVNVFLQVGDTVIQTGSGGESWNQEPNCGLDISSALGQFRTWRTNQGDDGNGLWHLMTNCYPPPGTVGIAYVGVLCSLRSGVGVSTFSSSTWKTVAHEIGHNFGASHSFEEGQGRTGGIMDYGNGYLNGEYQFNSKYRKDEVCGEISSSMGSNYQSVKNCWSTYQTECGNGIIEEGEDCDDNSSCCNSCKFSPGATCSGGACCTNCKLAPTTTTCGDSGYCYNGVCTTTICSQYSNLDFCGTKPDNPCEITCSINGGSECMTLNRYRLDGSLPDGAVCDQNTNKVCQNGQCVSTSTTPEWSVGTFGSCSKACGGGKQTRTVSCLSTNGNVLSDGECSGTKPSTSRDCNTTPCVEKVYVWAVSKGECNAKCEESGTRPITVYCLEQGTTNYVDHSYCNAGTKPSTSETCQGEPKCEEPTEEIEGGWQVTPWSDCSVTCGQGVQTREVSCKYTGYEWVCRYFNPNKPAASRPCNRPACGKTDWIVTQNDWTKCSAPCGPGTQSRAVECFNGKSTVDDVECEGNKPEVEVRPCFLKACPGDDPLKPVWVATEDFGTCSVPCGGDGIQTRIYICVNQDSIPVPEDLCAGSKPVDVTRPCYEACTETDDQSGDDEDPILAGLTTAAIVGIVVGCLALGAVIGAVVFFVVFKKQGRISGKGSAPLPPNSQYEAPTANPLYGKE